MKNSIHSVENYIQLEFEFRETKCCDEVCVNYGIENSYESAMHYDCIICNKENCPYRKTSIISTDVVNFRKTLFAIIAVLLTVFSLFYCIFI